jgi:hypothetical protein
MLGIFPAMRRDGIRSTTRRDGRMRLIVPHIRAPCVIVAGDRPEKHGKGREPWPDTLNGLNAGGVLVDESDRVIHANESGRSCSTCATSCTSPTAGSRRRSPGSQKALREVFGAARCIGAVAVGTRAFRFR